VNAVLILTDCELELITRPEDNERDNPIPILDAFFHRDLVDRIPESSRRGRPDIVHNVLLLCQASPSFQNGALRVYIHTRRDAVIEVGPGADIPPNYIDFLQKMGALLEGAKLSGFSLTQRSFSNLIADLSPEKVIVLTPEGRETSLAKLFHSIGDKLFAIVIGGFPEGDYKSSVYQLADERVSIGPRLMRVPEVVTAVLDAINKR
jgi:rRNA small subunit pseudouridine methyltransferase Nep1